MAEKQATWRRMRAEDLAAVMAVANEVHQDLPEDEAMFAERLALFPEGCLALDCAGGEIAGYAISHPIITGAPPRLNTLLGTIPPEARDYYIHDLALLPKLRGSGLARAGIEALLERARPFHAVALIAVHGTSGFWGRFGFHRSPRDMGHKLAPYGEGAVYMERAP